MNLELDAFEQKLRQPIKTPLLRPALSVLDGVSNLLGSSVPPIVDLSTLRQLPPGTLGRILADLLDRDGLDPFTTGPRRKQLHDSFHVITGYGTDSMGEAEIQAFMLGAKYHPMHLVLLFSILRVMHHRNRVRFPLSHKIVRQRLWAAYQRGRQSQFDPEAWQPETQWATPLSEVQASLGL